MKFVAIIFALALFVGGNEAWLRRRRRRTPTPCRPRNCQLSAWSRWSSCPCGASGTRNRTRRIIWPATCGGTCFFHLSEMQFCKRDCQNSGIPTRNGCLCPHGFLGACCEIAVPLTTRGDLELRTTTARSQTPTPRTSATKPRSRLTPLETSATAVPTTTKRSSSTTTTKVEQIHPSSTIPTGSTEQPQSNATSRITPATPSKSATASSSAIPSAKLPPVHFPNFLSFNNGNYNVSWIYNSETDRLHFMIDVMATGWVGFGVARRAPTGMQGYDVAVGGVLNGLAYLQDYLTVGLAQPQVDGQQDWALTYAKEENGKTTLQFYRRRDTRDPIGDVRIQQGAPIFLIWAYHITNDAQSGLLTFHGGRSRGFSNVLLIPVITPTVTSPSGFPSATLQPSPSPAFGGMNATSSTKPPFTGCGGILNMTSGTFASPGYPFSYTNNLNCLWTLPIPTDGVLSLQFERFTTERCCDFVELTVRTGQLARLSGSRNGFNITVRGDRSRVLSIRFTTDGSITGLGFLARYVIIFVPQPTSFTPFNNVTSPNTVQPPSNTTLVILPTEVRRALVDLLVSLGRIIVRLQGLIQGELTNDAFGNFRNDTLLILQQAERQLARPSGRYFGKRAIHELPDPEELAQMMDEIHRRLLD